MLLLIMHIYLKPKIFMFFTNHRLYVKDGNSAQVRKVKAAFFLLASKEQIL